MEKLNNIKGEIVLKSGILESEKHTAYKIALEMLKITGKRKAIVKALNNISLI